MRVRGALMVWVFALKFYVQQLNGLKRLSLSRNIKPKDPNIGEAVTKLVHLLAETDALEVLDLVGNQKVLNTWRTLCCCANASLQLHFGTYLAPFLEALSTNETLTQINVEGNYFLDEGKSISSIVAFADLGLLFPGAQVLGNAVAQNRTLKSLAIDDNMFTLDGFESFTMGVQVGRPAHAACWCAHLPLRRKTAPSQTWLFPTMTLGEL